MNRRSFLGAIIASATAPAIVRADSLMRIVPRETLVLGANDFTVEFWARPGIVNVFIEQEVDIIEVQTIGAPVRDLLTTAWRYSAADLQLELPPTIKHPRALRMDGRDVPMPEGATVETHPAGLRVLRIPSLDLTDYGNRIPRIEIAGTGDKQ